LAVGVVTYGVGAFAGFYEDAFGYLNRIRAHRQTTRQRLITKRRVHHDRVTVLRPSKKELLFKLRSIHRIQTTVITHHMYAIVLRGDLIRHRAHTLACARIRRPASFLEVDVSKTCIEIFLPLIRLLFYLSDRVTLVLGVDEGHRAALSALERIYVGYITAKTIDRSSSLPIPLSATQVPEVGHLVLLRPVWRFLFRCIALGLLLHLPLYPGFIPFVSVAQRHF